jgi:hypothetical protein
VCQKLTQQHLWISLDHLGRHKSHLPSRSLATLVFLLSSKFGVVSGGTRDNGAKKGWWFLPSRQQGTFVDDDECGGVLCSSQQFSGSRIPVDIGRFQSVDLTALLCSILTFCSSLTNFSRLISQPCCCLILTVFSLLTNFSQLILDPCCSILTFCCSILTFSPFWTDFSQSILQPCCSILMICCSRTVWFISSVTWTSKSPSSDLSHWVKVASISLVMVRQHNILKNYFFGPPVLES